MGLIILKLPSMYSKTKQIRTRFSLLKKEPQQVNVGDWNIPMILN